MIRRIPSSLFLVAVLLFSACSTSSMVVDDHFHEEWSRNVDLEEFGMAEVSPSSRYILITPNTRRKDLTLYSGTDGAARWRERPSLGQRFVSSISVGNLQVGDFQSDSYEYVILDDEGLVLIFDYTLSDDVIRAVNATTGETVWEQTGYAWTLEKFGVLGSIATREVFRATGSLNATRAVGTASLAATQGTFVQNLVRPVPEQDAFVFLTRDGLIGFDSRTGEEQWRIEEFEGGSLAEVLLLPDGDLIAVSGKADVLDDIVDDHHIARIDPESGEVVWMTDYDAGVRVIDFDVDTRAFIAEDALIVHTLNLQAFDLATGERRGNVRTQIHRDGLPPLAFDDEALYSAADALRENKGAGVSTGEQSRLARLAFDTGEETWSTDETNTSVYDLHRIGDLLLVAASGELMEGEDGVVALDAATGTVRWRSAPFEQVSGLTRASLRERVNPVFVSNLLSDGEAVYAAGPRAIYALDLETGETRRRIDHESADLGLVHLLFDEGDALGVISEHGVALYDKASGKRTFQTERDRVTGYVFAADRLFLQHGDDTSIVQLSTREMIGQFMVRPPKGIVFGNLGRGVVIAEEGRAVYLLDRKGTLAKYRL